VLNRVVDFMDSDSPLDRRNANARLYHRSGAAGPPGEAQPPRTLPSCGTMVPIP